LQHSQRQVLRTPRKPVFVMNLPQLGHRRPCCCREAFSRRPHQRTARTAAATDTQQRTYAPTPIALRTTGVRATTQMEKHKVVTMAAAALGSFRSFLKAVIPASSWSRVADMNSSTLEASANVRTRAGRSKPVRRCPQ
jgi:hypothetical protein